MRSSKDPVRLVVHGVSAESWSRRFGIEVFSHPCVDCGRPLTVSIPFAQGTMRGLMAPPCECGNDRTPYAVVQDARVGDLLDGFAVLAETAPFHGSESMDRDMVPVPSRSRRLCSCCRQRSTHIGRGGGVALVVGCELRIRRWVRNPDDDRRRRRRRS